MDDLNIEVFRSGGSISKNGKQLGLMRIELVSKTT
jgi:hypothetical protein